MPTVRFHLDISAERYLSYYQGVVRQVIATGRDGRRIQFPADKLRPFVSHDGVRGEFELEFDAQNKFIDLRRVSYSVVP
ncbi:MAG: DUF2835 domain-containing protein [Thiohalomonadaceae bacterium]